MTDVELDLRSEIDRLRDQLRHAKLVEVAVDEAFRRIHQELEETKAALATITSDRDALRAECAVLRLRAVVRQ